MKKCKVCSAIANDNDKFCSNCGNADFSVEYNNEEPKQFIVFPNGINPNGDGAEVRYFSDIPAASESKPKKKKSGKVVGIIFAVVLLLMAGGLALDIINDNSDDDNYDYSDITFEEGSIVDGQYQNEWADMSFDLSEGWTNGTEDDYAGINNELVTCGLYATKGTSTLTIAFIDISGDIETNTDDYLNEYLTGVTSSMDSAKSTEPTYQMFGNYSYVYSDTVGKVNGAELHLASCMRKLDDYIILISATGASKDSNHVILDQIG